MGEILSSNKSLRIKYNEEFNVVELCSVLGKVFLLLEKEVLSVGDNYYKFSNKFTQLRFKSVLRVLINNLISGVYKELEVVGLGFNFGLYFNKNVIRFEGGYSHRIYLRLGKRAVVFTEKKRLLVFSNSKKNLMGVVMDLRKLKKLDAYKGKGIRFKNEIIVLKLGKKR